MKICGVIQKLLGCALAVLLIAGCDRPAEDTTDFLPPGDFTEVESRLENVETGAVKFIDMMAPDDIIVAVNGYPLTRRYFDLDLSMSAKALLKRHKGDAYTVNELMEERKKLYVEQFVMKRLLLDDAKRQKLLTEEEVRAGVMSYLRGLGNSGKKKQTAAEVWKSLSKETRPHVLYDIAERMWVAATIATNIPPLVTVDAAFVSNVQATVTAENLAAKRTNDSIRVKMQGWKNDIMSGKITFEEIADKHSSKFNGAGVGKGGAWGTFEESELDSRRVARAVFKLRLGEISDPLEDENGYHLVKVLQITPPEKNERGRIIQKELRKLAHVYIEKEPELIRQTDAEMFADLRQQMQMQAVYYYTEVLMTNGQNKVVYPHGNKLFR